MKASIVDLRYHMHDVIKALDRNESVEILYHRKKIGVITPTKNESPEKVQDHPFFGMAAHNELSVEDVMQQLRGGRYNDDI
ncbi:MAG: type II toxin-antitoxin system Phd/YefM family antitoxin [Legionellales bacterium]|nr:type II toxin-antitoxin system Phd/YefM family antitoxin [Legionellales bacterium]